MNGTIYGLSLFVNWVSAVYTAGFVLIIAGIVVAGICAYHKYINTITAKKKPDRRKT